MRCGGFYSTSTDDRRWLWRGFSSARGAFDQQPGKDHEIVGEHSGADEQFEALSAFGAATVHATPAHHVSRFMNPDQLMELKA
jgi:hypothetical protein